MAIFHLHVKNISRSDGRSAVAAAAYRAGETLPNEAEERESAFGGRRDVLHAEIRLPSGAPAWMADRAQLWNGAEKAEARKDARLAKEIEVALPRELTDNERLALVRELAEAYVAQGFAVDLAIHDDGSGHNPHAHLMLTTRHITPAGFGGKIREADGRMFVVEARKLWAKITNTTFAKSGTSLTIDHRSHADAGIDRVPTRHLGPDPLARRARREQMKSEDRKSLRNKLPEERSDSHSTVTTIKVDGDEREIDPEMHGVWGQESWLRGDVPVPDPQGNAIPFRELERAEDAMLAAMEGPVDSVTDPVPDAPREDPWWTRRHLGRPPEGTSVEENYRWWDKASRPTLEAERHEAEERLDRRRGR